MAQEEDFQSGGPDSGTRSLPGCWCRLLRGRILEVAECIHWCQCKGLRWARSLFCIDRFDLHHIGHCWYSRNRIGNPFVLRPVHNRHVHHPGTRVGIRMCTRERDSRRWRRGRNHWEIGYYIHQCLKWKLSIRCWQNEVKVPYIQDEKTNSFFFLRLLECLLYLKSNVEDHSVLKSPK